MITSQCNAGADALQVHMRCVVTSGKPDRSTFRNALLVQLGRWCTSGA